MVEQKKHFTPLLKLIALFLVLSFCLTTIKDPSLYAQSLPGTIHPHHGSDQVNPVKLMDSLKLPEELGVIQEFYVPDSTDPSLRAKRSNLRSEIASASSGMLPRNDKQFDKLVIYVQSAHANYDSEVHTKEIINFFCKKYGLGLVLLEGGEGRLDSLFFKSFPNERLKAKLLDEYLKKSDLTGAEVSSILTDTYDTKYYGIENQALYEQNKQAFLEAVSNEAEIKKILDQAEKTLLDLTQSQLTEKVKTFLDHRRSFQKEELDLMEYVKALLSLREGPGNSYPELSKLLSVESSEKNV